MIATLRPTRVRNVLLATAGALSVLTLISRLVEHEWPGSTAAHGLWFLDATREATIPTFFQALVLLACAGLAAGIAQRLRSRRWLLLSAALAFLAVDEAAAIHESTIGPLRRALDAGGILYFTWVVPGALLVAAAVVVFRPLLADLGARERRLAVVAVGIFFAAALGLELPEGLIADHAGGRGLERIPLETAEEALEMLGAALFLYALALRLEPWEGTLRLRDPDS